MKLPDARIELAASTDPSRYTLQSVKVDVEKKRIMATDGYILAVLPVEVSDKDHSGLITTSSIKQLRAMEKRKKPLGIEITLNGKVTATGGGETAEFPLGEGQFPNAEAVIPNYEGPATISFDAELLYRLAKAMIEPGRPLCVSLTVKDPMSSVLVKAKGVPEAVGVLMPIRS
jgi:DNA polymerase III sliding clamp (beta) subunit (PCNA family)